MEDKKFLNEETYQKNRKKIIKVSLIVLIIGILIGCSLVVIGIISQRRVNSKYSDENKQKLQEKIAIEKKNLEIKKSELISKGIKYDSFAKYDEGDIYDLKIITEALDPGFNYCSSDEYQNNSLTSTYCSYKQQLDDLGSFDKGFDSYKFIPFYVIGAFVIFLSCMIAGSIYMTTKRREILAFTTQQVMPVAKEGIDTMAPTIGNVAKEISKGIKEGSKEDKE